MFQEYYKSKAKYYLERMENFNKKKLVNLKNFNDAVKKYNKFKTIYDKARYCISKLPCAHIDNENVLYSQIKSNLDNVYNESVIKALKSNTENHALSELKKIKADLNSSYGYGFDSYISEYHQALYNIIGKHKMIYKNYNDNLKENISINMENAKDPLYKEIVEFITESGKVSVSLLQRRFRLSYNRATHIVKQLEADGLIGPQNGTNPRKVLIDFKVNNSFTYKSFIDFETLYSNDSEIIGNKRN